MTFDGKAGLGRDFGQGKPYPYQSPYGPELNHSAGSMSPAERVAMRQGLLTEALRRPTTTKAEIIKGIANYRLADIFQKKTDFIEDDVTAPYYVKEFVVWAAEIVSEVEAFKDQGFNGEKFFSVLLDGYRRVPKLCCEALCLLVNVEDFLDQHGALPPSDRSVMRIRALSVNMGKGILSASQLIKAAIITVRKGDGKLHDGPVFKELNRLFDDKEDVYDEMIRVAFRSAWKSAYNALADAGIPERYRFNMHADNLVTSLIKIIIADTAMERRSCGLNFRKRKLRKPERIGEIIRHTGTKLKYPKEATLLWLGAQRDQKTLDLVYLPSDSSMLDIEGMDTYAENLLECVKALFHNVGEVDRGAFKAVLRGFLSIQFSAKKKFILRITPKHDCVNVMALDYSGDILIRKEDIPTSPATATIDLPGREPLALPLAQPQPAPSQRRKRTLDLDI